MINPPPSHYPDGPYQPRLVVKAWGLGYNLGCVLKYVCRAGKKGPALDDLIKARDFLDFAIDDLANDVLAKAEHGPSLYCVCADCDNFYSGTPCK